jgi:hypothetical protein
MCMSLRIWRDYLKQRCSEPEGQLAGRESGTYINDTHLDRQLTEKMEEISMQDSLERVWSGCV